MGSSGEFYNTGLFFKSLPKKTIKSNLTSACLTGIYGIHNNNNFNFGFYFADRDSLNTIIAKNSSLSSTDLIIVGAVLGVCLIVCCCGYYAYKYHCDSCMTDDSIDRVIPM